MLFNLKGLNVTYFLKAVFTKKKYCSPLKCFTSGYKLEDYVIGKQIGKGSNAAVYEAAAPLSVPRDRESDRCSLNDQPSEDGEVATGSLRCPSSSLGLYPLAVKRMWNFGVGVCQDNVLFPQSLHLFTFLHGFKVKGLV